MENSGTENGISTYTITKKDLKVLLCISQSISTNKLIAKETRIPKQTISRITNKLKDLNLIYYSREFNIKRFALTQSGKDTCTIFLAVSKSHKVSELPLRCHNLNWTSRIIRKPKNFEEKLKQNNWIESIPRNWKQYRKKYDQCTIMFNPETIQYFPYDFFTSTIEEYRQQSKNIILRQKQIIEEEYQGLVLGEPECVAKLNKQHIARQYDPLALEFFKTAQKLGVRVHFHGKNIDIDTSKGIAELETKDKAKAPEHLIDIAAFFDQWVEKPISVDELHHVKNKTNETQSNIDKINENLNKVAENIKSLTENIGSFGDNQKLFAENIKSHLNLINEYREEVKDMKKPFFVRWLQYFKKKE